MDLLRPKNYIPSYPNSSLQREYLINQNGLEIQKTVAILFEHIDINNPVNLNNLREDDLNKYLRIQNLIQGCNQVGEEVNNQLRDLLLRLKPVLKKELDDIVISSDFMKLRGYFSTLIKKNDPIKKIQQLNISVKRDIITKTLCDFILDRNKYIHGVLIISKPDNKYLLEYIDKNEGKRLCLINEATLISFIQIGQVFKSIFKDISIVNQNL